MRAFRWILLPAICSILAAQDHPFSIGEKLVYNAGFRLLSVGTTIMELTGPDTIGADTTYHVLSRVQTFPVFNRLYRINDRVDLWLDRRSLELRRMKRNINEGRFHRRDSARVDVQAGLIYTRTGTLELSGTVLDPIGAIYYFRTLELNLGDRVQITLFDGRRLRPVAVEVSKIVSIKVPAGRFECLLLVPSSLDDRPMTKVNGFLRLWLTNDAARIPVRVEQRTKYGTMVLKMTEYYQE
ncbi:MAG: DUF3108 domain-containing protein [Candidatus Neomarinimicrobiota bacterium]